MESVSGAYGAPNGTRIHKDRKEYFHDYDHGYGPCKLYWIVNKNDVVVDWRHEGRGCTEAWSIH